MTSLDDEMKHSFICCQKEITEWSCRRGISASFADVNVKDRRFINGGKILTITRQIVCWKTIDQSDLKNTMSTDLNK